MNCHSDPRISRGDMCTEQPKLDFLDIDLQVSFRRIRINCHRVELVIQLSMFCIAARTFEWTVQTEPFIRVARRGTPRCLLHCSLC